MFLYKGINPMDSMLGYKNDKYLYFGRIAAKLDDVGQLYPCQDFRMADGGRNCFYRNGYETAAKIYKRDRRNHASPNSAQTRGCHGRSAGCTSLREMHIISGIYLKNPRSGIRSARWSRRISKELTRLMLPRHPYWVWLYLDCSVRGSGSGY